MVSHNLLALLPFCTGSAISAAQPSVRPETDKIKPCDFDFCSIRSFLLHCIPFTCSGQNRNALIQERIHGAFLSFIRNALPGPARPAGGLSYRETIIRSALEEKRFTYDQLADYLGPVVRWDLTEEYLQGLNTFYTMAHEMNLIEHMPKIQFAKISE